MWMWLVAPAVIIVIVIFPKILELLIGSQRDEYKDRGQEDENGSNKSI
jgi:hypothetical protein